MMEKEKKSFAIGWAQVRPCDAANLKNSIMSYLHINNRTSWAQLIGSGKTLTRSQCSCINSMFASLGIYDVWDDVSNQWIVSFRSTGKIWLKNKNTGDCVKFYKVSDLLQYAKLRKIILPDIDDIALYDKNKAIAHKNWCIAKSKKSHNSAKNQENTNS